MAGVLPNISIQLRPLGGIALGLYPSSDPSCDLELHRADPGSTVTFTPIVRLGVGSGQGVMQYSDRMPVDNLTRFYKLRSVKDGLTASAFTNTVSAKPLYLPTGPIPTPALSGNKIGVTAWVSSATPIQIGSPQSTGQITKQLRFLGSLFRPTKSSIAGAYWSTVAGSNFGSLQEQGTTGTRTYFMPYPLPNGVTVTKLTLRWSVLSSKSSGTLRLYRVDSVGAATLIATITSTFRNLGPAVVKNTSVMNVTVSSSRAILATLSFRNFGIAGDPVMYWTELQYKQGTYVQTY